MKQKISAWLKEQVDSHTIYSHDPMVDNFEKETGKKASWPHHTPERIKEGIEGRGLGGDFYTETPSEKLCCGYEMAEALAMEYADYGNRGIQGRGSRFRLAIEMLEEAGY